MSIKHKGTNLDYGGRVMTPMTSPLWIRHCFERSAPFSYVLYALNTFLRILHTIGNECHLALS